ncbi:16S rRNA (guanine(527)-N(7))-methyltransferase RsmG [Persicitalea jodogahamensis]|uniref:Ribosomal RNA small subunit methyltransferase G n=1 Tax=Persicitalea jodogahamensis TaxID=402147 RepID=A0A8J3D432_9BACT|nr:16S rRNA (guanine(527)-N(7))-methyltransferase RsmG [Persicitalea jodogahamensis]GHB69646.1 ribosomal RNA small subunit methyltransferase G [Persicitalea jodogahamensis]
MEIILKYFPDLTERQREQFAQLEELYRVWNAQINVISRKDIDALYERHVLHSLGIAKVIQFRPGTTILDVGTGGGFPGIPLAILFPQAHFHLIDSIGKKIKVVQEVTDALKLPNVVAEKARAEYVERANYEFVLSRAVTRLAPFVDWVRHGISPNSFHELKNGVLCLKGGDLADEISEYKGRVKIFDLNDDFEEEFFETKKVVYVPLSTKN